MSTTTPYCFVFDTNAYSDISAIGDENSGRNEVSKPIDNKAIVGVKAFASPTVMFELIVSWDEAPADKKEKHKKELKHWFSTAGILQRI